MQRLKFLSKKWCCYYWLCRRNTSVVFVPLLQWENVLVILKDRILLCYFTFTFCSSGANATKTCQNKTVLYLATDKRHWGEGTSCTSWNKVFCNLGAATEETSLIPLKPTLGGMQKRDSPEQNIQKEVAPKVYPKLSQALWILPKSWLVSFQTSIPNSVWNGIIALIYIQMWKGNL